MNTQCINLTEQQIKNELTAIGDLLDMRYNDLCNNAPALAGLVHSYQLLEPHEAERMHNLKIALTIQYGHLYTPQAAHQRIMDQIKARKSKSSQDSEA